MPTLTDRELEDLLRSGESDSVERKRNASDLDRIREAVCGFANDLPDHRRPGVVFVGIEDDGSCADIAIDDVLPRQLGQIRDDGGITPFPSCRSVGSLFQGVRPRLLSSIHPKTLQSDAEVVRGFELDRGLESPHPRKSAG